MNEMEAGDGALGTLGQARRHGRRVATPSLDEDAAVRNTWSRLPVRPLTVVEADAGMLLVSRFMEGRVNAE